METSIPPQNDVAGKKPWLAYIGSALTAVGIGMILWSLLIMWPRHQAALTAAEAAQDVLDLAKLQDVYRTRAKVYANSFDELAKVSQDPKALREKLSRHVDLETLVVRGTSTHYRFEANALNPRRTMIRWEGPSDR